MLRKNENIVSRSIHGSFFLIDITDNYANDTCALYEINETGKFIWENINGNNSLKDIAQLLKSALIDDIAFDIIYNDVDEFVSYLIEKEYVMR